MEPWPSPPYSAGHPACFNASTTRLVRDGVHFEQMAFVFMIILLTDFIEIWRGGTPRPSVGGGSRFPQKGVPPL